MSDDKEKQDDIIIDDILHNKIMCSQCKEPKTIDGFHRDRSRVEGIKNRICKTCTYLNLIKKKRDMMIGNKDYSTNYPEPDFNKLYEKGEAYTTAIFGSSRSGKTTFLKYLYKNYLSKLYDVKIMFSTNSHVKNYEVFKTNEGHLLDKFNDDLAMILHTINKKTNNYFSVLLMMDDEINQKSNKTLKNSFITWRNANISTMISLQASSLLDKSSRNNMHRLVLMKLNSSEEIMEICERLLMALIEVPKNIHRIHDKKKWLYNWYIEHTSNYNFIILDLLESPVKIYQYKTPTTNI